MLTLFPMIIWTIKYLSRTTYGIEHVEYYLYANKIHVLTLTREWKNMKKYSNSKKSIMSNLKIFGVIKPTCQLKLKEQK